MPCPTSFMSGRTVDQRQDCAADFAAITINNLPATLPTNGFRGFAGSTPCVPSACQSAGCAWNEWGTGITCSGNVCNPQTCPATCINTICPNLTDSSASVGLSTNVRLGAVIPPCTNNCAYECTPPSAMQLYFTGVSNCSTTLTPSVSDSYPNSGGTYAIHGYDPSKKNDCCVGNVSDNVNCALCWCPGTQSCNNGFMEYCAQKDATGEYNMFSDINCQTWAGTKDKPGKGYTMAQTLITSSTGLCSGDGLLTTGCNNYCGNIDNIGQCDANLNQYCQHLPQSTALANPICACYMPDLFYDNITNQMAAQLGPNINAYVSANSQACIYPPCNASYVQPKNPGGAQCPSISSCVDSFTINDDNGTIIGTITATPDNLCGFTNTAPTSAPSTGTPSSAPSTGTPSSAPATGVPSSTPPINIPTLPPPSAAKSWLASNQITVGVIILISLLLLIFLFI